MSNKHAASEGADRDTTNRRRGEFIFAWGEVMSADRINFWREYLAGIVDELSEREHWTDERAASVLYIVFNGPMGDLLPDVNHYQDRLEAARALDCAVFKERF